MKGTAASIHNAVREIITHNRTMHDCIKMGIANYTAIAAKIQPDVERHIGALANTNTIVVAVKRYADSFERLDEPASGDVLKDARLSLTDGMMGISFTASGLDGDPFSVLDRFSEITNDYEFFRMSDTFSVITEDAAAARDFFGGVGGQSRLSGGLAKIRISWSGEQNRSDVVSYVAEVLHDGGIELSNVFFGHDNVTIILDERNAARAYELLRSRVSR